MGRLRGGASGPDHGPSPLFPDLDEYEARELARASRELLERGRPEGRPPSRWERVWVEGEGLVEVEVERIVPGRDE